VAWRKPGKRGVVAVHRLDEILAQTDPFDLAQGVERHVSTLDGASIRELVAPVLDRAGKYYRNELSFLLDPGLSDDALRKAFTRFLKSNLRAIALFGNAFSQDVLKACPQHRVVAIGEEGVRISEGQRTLVAFGTAIALVIIGAAAEHAVSTARAAAQGPQPSFMRSIPVSISATAPPRKIAVPPPAPRQAAPRPAPAPAEHVAQRTPEALYPVDATANPPVADPPEYPAQSYRYYAPERAHVRSTAKPIEAKGAVINVTVTAPPPTPAPTPIGVDDMPQAFSDATPLPQQSAAPVDDAARQVDVATPKPTSKPKSWLHRTIMHFDPFQPGAHIRIP
jgi:hypothetical protein